MIIETDYKIDENQISYEITESGYKIYLGGNLWISQEKYIPYQRETMQESVLAHIEKIIQENVISQTVEDGIAKEEFITMQQDITDLDLRIIALEG